MEPLSQEISFHYQVYVLDDEFLIEKVMGGLIFDSYSASHMPEFPDDDDPFIVIWRHYPRVPWITVHNAAMEGGRDLTDIHSQLLVEYFIRNTEWRDSYVSCDDCPDNLFLAPPGENPSDPKSLIEIQVNVGAGTMSDESDSVESDIEDNNDEDDDKDSVHSVESESLPASQMDEFERNPPMKSQFRHIVNVIVIALVVLLISFIPAIALHKWPDWYSPPAAYMSAVIMTALTGFVTYSLGIFRESAVRDEIERQHRRRWLPQAESACSTLLTIQSDTRIMLARIDTACKRIEKSLPDLSPENAAAVKRILSAHCEECIGPLSSIESHLQSGVDEWDRFINDNCSEDECATIAGRLRRRQEQLEAKVAAAKNRFDNLGACGDAELSPGRQDSR